MNLKKMEDLHTVMEHKTSKVQAKWISQLGTCKRSSSAALNKEATGSYFPSFLLISLWHFIHFELSNGLCVLQVSMVQSGLCGFAGFVSLQVCSK